MLVPRSVDDFSCFMCQVSISISSTQSERVITSQDAWVDALRAIQQETTALQVCVTWTL